MHSHSLLLNQDPLSALKLTTLRVNHFQFHILLLRYSELSGKHHEFAVARGYLVDV